MQEEELRKAIEEEKRIELQRKELALRLVNICLYIYIYILNISFILLLVCIIDLIKYKMFIY